MRHQNVTSPDTGSRGTRGLAGAPRPLGRAAVAMSTALSRAWSLPPRRNYVAVDRKLRVPMSDGTVLLADHYLPIIGRPAATVLVRCPYGRSAPFSLLYAQLVAERGYHVLLQSCRGTFGSGGEFEPMRHEAADGQDTVAWLRGQSWFDGRLATYGLSYLGFVQWALAMDVRLCDVDPSGRSRNVCDGIVRLTGADPLTGTVQVSLIATGYRFGPGHRLRLQVAGGAHPRFARNPGNGLLDASPADLVSTGYTIGLDAGSPSVLLLSAPAQARAGTQGGAAAHA
jgi:predicted acyl esterase